LGFCFLEAEAAPAFLGGAVLVFLVEFAAGADFLRAAVSGIYLTPNDVFIFIIPGERLYDNLIL
jgi:hypothetical protein